MKMKKILIILALVSVFLEAYSTEFDKHVSQSPETLTYKAIESDFTEIYIKPFKGVPMKIEDSAKKFSNVVGSHFFIKATDGTGKTLNFRLVSKDRKELALSFPRQGDKYDFETIEIPENVNINDEIYTVTEIDSRTFGEKGAEKIANIIFPKTLKRIHSGAFVKCVNLQSIELPEYVEEIAMGAFVMAGSSCKTFRQLYIPKNIKTIGEGVFQFVGPNTSYRGYYQGTLTSIPDWITVGNCTNYGIDENAVEDYERRMGIRK